MIVNLSTFFSSQNALLFYFTILPTALISSCTKPYEKSVNIDGHYRWGDTTNAFGEIYLYSLNDSTALFYFQSYNGYNLGELFGEINIKDTIGYSFTQDEFQKCNLKFIFTRNEVEIITMNDCENCGFGYGVCADGLYELKPGGAPKYFIDIGSRKISFEGLTLEKYKNLYNDL